MITFAVWQRSLALVESNSVQYRSLRLSTVTYKPSVSATSVNEQLSTKLNSIALVMAATDESKPHPLVTLEESLHYDNNDPGIARADYANQIRQFDPRIVLQRRCSSDLDARVRAELPPMIRRC